MPFVPRGRWSLLRYSAPANKQYSERLDVYTVVNPGSGVTELAAGDLVLAAPDKLRHVGNGFAYGQIDNGGILAKWNDAFGEPVMLFGALFLHIVDVDPPNDGVIGYFDDARVLRVISVGVGVTDIAVDDVVIVPRRDMFSVGHRPEERFIAAAESVVAKEA